MRLGTGQNRAGLQDLGHLIHHLKLSGDDERKLRTPGASTPASSKEYPGKRSCDSTLNDNAA